LLTVGFCRGLSTITAKDAAIVATHAGAQIMTMASEQGSTRTLAYQTQFKRVLTLKDLIIYGIVFITPTAPYPVFGIVGAIAHGHVALTYLIGMIAMMLTALSYGRMASAFPAAGSTYTFTQRGLSPHLGFFAGWSMFLDYSVKRDLCRTHPASHCTHRSLRILGGLVGSADYRH
jgi:hypothetical protein